MNEKLYKSVLNKLGNVQLTPGTREREKEILEVLRENDRLRDEHIRLSAEIAVKDMALADKNEECASLYLRLEEIERYHYDEARKRG